MRRFWLAAVLGIIIGLGIALSPTSIGSQEKAMLQLTGENQPARYTATSEPTNQYLALAILLGLAVAIPVFLVARRRLG